MLDLDAARARLLAALPPAPTGAARVRLDVAAGRVLAGPLRAPTDLPLFDRSLVDGYALGANAPRRLPVAGAVAMGTGAPALAPGTAVQVPTGAMLPAGTVAVVMQEHVRHAGGMLEVLRPPADGDNLVRRGADARRGAEVLPAGLRLRPEQVAMLATIGRREVAVRRRPRIAILSTGDELVPAGGRTEPGQVPDSNGPALAAALRRDGAVPVPLGIAPDRRASVAALVARGLEADALICSGGSSVGAQDYVQDVLAQALGAEPVFSGLALRPGRPTAVFIGGGRWAVALPGHAVSALVVYELLLRDVVRLWGGERPVPPRGTLPLTLAAEVRAPADREFVARVRIAGDRAVPLSGASAAIGNLSGADALVRCPAGDVLAAGAVVAALLLQ